MTEEGLNTQNTTIYSFKKEKKKPHATIRIKLTSLKGASSVEEDSLMFGLVSIIRGTKAETVDTATSPKRAYKTEVIPIRVSEKLDVLRQVSRGLPYY